MRGGATSRWLWSAFAVLAADRATKFAIEHYTSEFFRLPILSDIVILVHNQNPGIAFGVFSNSSSRWLAPLLLVSSVLVIALLVWLLVTGRAGGSLAQAGLALILGGAAGNALDRLIHGGVTDFLEVSEPIAGPRSMLPIRPSPSVQCWFLSSYSSAAATGPIPPNAIAARLILK
jgi:signal peptidase II